jgi:hypothetical protein
MLVGKWSVGLPIFGCIREQWFSSSAGHEMDNLMRRIQQAVEE